MIRRQVLATGLMVAALGGSASTAVADEAVSIHVEDDGTVVGTVSLLADPAAVRQILGDVGDSSKLSADVLSVRVTPTGPCEEVFRETRGLLEPMLLHTQRCPTEHGWRETLVEVGDFAAYDAEWILRSPEKGGVQVEYRLKTSPTIWIPQTIVEINVVRAVRQTLGALSAPFKKKRSR